MCINILYVNIFLWFYCFLGSIHVLITDLTYSTLLPYSVYAKKTKQLVCVSQMHAAHFFFMSYRHIVFQFDFHHFISPFINNPLEQEAAAG